MAADNSDESDGRTDGREADAAELSRADASEERRTLRQLLQERDARIDELGTLSEKRETEWRRLVDKRDNRIAVLTKRLAKRDQTLAKARAEVGEARAGERQANRELSHLRRSWTWRLTAPLRVLSLRRREEPPKQRPAAPAPAPADTEPPPLPDSDWEIGKMQAPAIRNGKRGLGRIAVFSAVVGGYDTMREPTVIDPKADYYLFTDRPVSAGSVWQARDFDVPLPDPTRTARYVKTHAHRYFPNHDWAISMDGNLKLAALPEDFISDENADRDIIAWHHPDRDCVYDEVEECVALNKDDEALMRRQVADLRASGYPAHNGLIASSVLVFRHNRPAVAAFLDDWWQAIETGSRRDQLSFNPTLYRHREIKIGYLAPHGVEMHNDPRVIYAYHRPAKSEPAASETTDP